MYADGYDLRRASLVERKEFLQQILAPNERIHFSEHIPEQGEALYEAARGKGLEGIIAKLKNSTYAGARTSTWVKLKIVDELDAVIAGYTEGRGSRKFFGALVLGLYEGKELKFIGSVGTGFDESKQEKIFDKLKPLQSKTSPFAKIPALRENVDWVEPELVARVKFANWTNDNHLRAPVFVSLLTDRTAKDCTMEDAKPESTAALETKAVRENPAAKKTKSQPKKKEAAVEVEQDIE